MSALDPPPDCDVFYGQPQRTFKNTDEQQIKYVLYYTQSPFMLVYLEKFYQLKQTRCILCTEN